MQNAANTKVDYSTPIRNAYARANQQYDRSWNNPLGAYTTADVRQKASQERNDTMNQSMGLDLANAAQQNASGEFNRLSTVAGLTRPQMYGSGSTTKVSDPLGTAQQIGSKAAGVGMAAM